MTQKQLQSPDPVDQNVGECLKRLRIRRGMSQTALAAQLGVTFQQVQKYERGTNRISASRLYHIARVLRVRPAFFFENLAGANAAILPPMENDHLRLLRYYNALCPAMRKKALTMLRGLRDL